MTRHHGLAGALLLILAMPVRPTPEPAEITLTLRCAGDQRTFHPGEIIPLELEFTSPIRKRFVIEDVGDGRDQSLDEFHVSPDKGVSDPMLDLLAGGGCLDCLSGVVPLKGKPEVLKRTLNQW